MNFGQMIYNLIRKKLGKIGINSSASNYRSMAVFSLVPLAIRIPRSSASLRVSIPRFIALSLGLSSIGQSEIFNLYSAMSESMIQMFFLKQPSRYL